VVHTARRFGNEARSQRPEPECFCSSAVKAGADFLYGGKNSIRKITVILAEKAYFCGSFSETDNF
jgi:hypothetical protein